MGIGSMLRPKVARKPVPTAASIIQDTTQSTQSLQVIGNERSRRPVEDSPKPSLRDARAASSEELERYRLNAIVHNDHTIQTVRDYTTGTDVEQTWKRRRHLGAGAFGEVWQEAHEDEYNDWHYRAVKSCSEAYLKATQIDYKRELAALAVFSRSECAAWFVNLHGWWINSGRLFIATEYLGRGDLSNYVKSGIPEIGIREITDNILRGLETMHNQGFTHRDIKPKNILVYRKRPESRNWWVKIADFGISKQVLPDCDTALRTSIGTRAFCAPEILGYIKDTRQGLAYSNKVDLWSLGCLIFNLASDGRMPFDEGDLVRYCDGRFPFNEQNVQLCLSGEGSSLVKDLLHVDPGKRPSASSSLQHDWFSVPLGEEYILRIPRQETRADSKFYTGRESTLSAWPADSSVTPNIGQNRVEPVILAQQLPSQQIRTLENMNGDPITKSTNLPISSAHVEVEASKPPVSSSTATNQSTMDGKTEAKFCSLAEQFIDKVRMHKYNREPMSPEYALKLGEKITGMFDNLDLCSLSVPEGYGQTIYMTWRRYRGCVRSYVSSWTLSSRTTAVRDFGVDPLEDWEQVKRYYALDDITDKQWLSTWLSEIAYERLLLGYSEIWVAFIAASRGRLDILKILLAKHSAASVMRESHHGITLLNEAMTDPSLRVIKWIVENGGNLTEIGNPLRESLLFDAARQGSIRLTKWLVDSHLMIDSKDVRGRTALFHAVAWDRLGVAKYLVSVGANLNIKDMYGNTMVFEAVQLGHDQMLRWLLDVDKRLVIHPKGRLYSENARKRGHANLADWLVQKENEVKTLDQRRDELEKAFHRTVINGGVNFKAAAGK